MHDCLASFGSNVGDGRRTFSRVAELLTRDSSIDSLVCSQPVTTRPIGGPIGQGAFVNGCLRFLAAGTPAEIHQTLRSIETALGRARRERWGSRTVDLDLLLCDQLELSTGTLTIPHPRMSFRRFVLQPACEIAAEMWHPTSRSTLGELLNHLDSKPNRILCLTNDQWLIETVDGIAQQFTGAGWTIDCIAADDFREKTGEATKLLVLPGRSPASLPAWISDFRGPMLILDDQEDIVVELVAAVEAMSAL